MNTNNIDAECVELCTAINLFNPAIYTVESCCGHGESPYRVWFRVNDYERLPELLYWFDRCHCGHSGWSVIATTGCGIEPVTYELVGPVEGFSDSEHIASLIKEYVEEVESESK